MTWGSPVRSRLGLLVTVVAIAANGVLPTSGAESTEPAPDCGPAALHALLWAEGHPVAFADVVAQLPSQPGGHSLQELRDVAGHFGLKREGVTLGKNVEALDRPLLAWIKDDRLRHFLVVRPVGHTGSLVQIIDSTDAPRVIDKTELVASRQWTGVVLRPVRGFDLAWPAQGQFTPPRFRLRMAG